MKRLIIVWLLVLGCSLYSNAQVDKPQVQENKSNSGKNPYVLNYDGDELDEEPMAQVDDDVIEELSGIIFARGHQEYWGVSDRGNDEEIYRFNRQGKILQIVELKGTENYDWEALTRDHSGNLYIGDVGDNNYEREFCSIYKLAEPAAQVEEVDREDIIEYRFRYSDGISHNCESMFFFREKLFLLSKEEPFEKSPKIFRIDEFVENKMLEAKLVGSLKPGSEITDAAYSSAFNTVILLTYDDIIFYPIHEQSDFLAFEPIYVEIDFDQCEAICFDGSEIIIGNEDGELWFYPVSRFLHAE